MGGTLIARSRLGAGSTFVLTLPRAADCAGDGGYDPARSEIPHWLVAVEVLLKRWVVRESERSVVAEVDARHVPGAQGDHCLICETDRAMRRIWRYPVDWHGLEDAKLIALFDQPFTAAKPASAAIPLAIEPGAGVAREVPRPVERQAPRELTVER